MKNRYIKVKGIFDLLFALFLLVALFPLLLIIYTLVYLILFGLIKPIILNVKMDTNWAIMSCLVLFIWIFLTKCFTYMII